MLDVENDAHTATKNKYLYVTIYVYSHSILYTGSKEQAENLQTKLHNARVFQCPQYCRCLTKLILSIDYSIKTVT